MSALHRGGDRVGRWRRPVHSPFETIPLNHVRSAMEKPNGKLVIHAASVGRARADGRVDLTTTTIVDLEGHLIRAR